MDQFISALRVDGWKFSFFFLIILFHNIIFHFYSNFDRIFCKQTVETPVLHCLSMSHKRDAGLIWVKTLHYAKISVTLHKIWLKAVFCSIVLIRRKMLASRF